MRIKPFNEIMADLKGAGSTNMTEDIEELAKQLHAQGIANSMMEAREKAKSMISIEQNVTEEYTEKKKELTTYNDPRNNPEYNKYREAMVNEMRQRAMEKPKQIKIQDEFQTPGFEQKNGNTGLPRAVVTDRPREQAPVEQPPVQPETPEESKKAKFDTVNINDIFKTK